MKFIVGFAVTLAALAQPGFTKPIFTTDTLDPKRGEAATLLEAVCPGRVEAGQTAAGYVATCRGGCEAFPAAGGVDPSFSGGWQVTGVLRGHFLAPSSEDAILGMEGCVPHGADNGGSFLLTLRSGKWLLVW